MPVLRKQRFTPSVPFISQKAFYQRNFLKHYDQTSKDPKFCEIAKCLKELDGGTGKFENIMELLRSLPNEDDIIKAYSSNETVGEIPFYTYLNKQLHDDDDNTISKLMPIIRRATKQINNNPPKCDCVVYRGIDLEPEDKDHFKVGKILRFPGFTSTSKSKEKAKGFGNTLLAIEIYDGCLQVRDISSISKAPYEEEYLFSPYSLFEIVDIDADVFTLKAIDNLSKVGMDDKDS